MNVCILALDFQVADVLKSAENLLSDTSSFGKFKKYCESFMDELAAYMKENHENWMKDTIESIDDTEKPLRYFFLLL